jgi:hypothetical protein
MWLLFQVAAIQWGSGSSVGSRAVCFISLHQGTNHRASVLLQDSPLNKGYKPWFSVSPNFFCVTLVWLVHIWYATEHMGTVFHMHLFIIARHCTPELVIRSVSRKWKSCHSQQTDCVMEFCYDIYFMGPAGVRGIWREHSGQVEFTFTHVDTAQHL